MSANNEDRAENGTTSTFQIDGRKMRAWCRDAAPQPNRDYTPINDRILLSVDDERAITRASTNGFRAWCAYENPPIRHLDTASDQPLMAVINFTDLLTRDVYLDSGIVEFTFMKKPELKYASSCTISGDLNGTSFETELSLADKMTSSGSFSGVSETTIETTTEALEPLLRAFYHKNGADSQVEIRVEDGVFRVDTHDDEGAHIWGDLDTDHVEGSDVVNRYPYRPLMLIVRRFDGPVTLKTGPGEPLEVTHQEDNRKRSYLIDTV